MNNYSVIVAGSEEAKQSAAAASAANFSIGNGAAQ